MRDRSDSGGIAVNREPHPISDNEASTEDWADPWP
jgi:hypothetical protein